MGEGLGLFFVEPRGLKCVLLFFCAYLFCWLLCLFVLLTFSPERACANDEQLWAALKQGAGVQATIASARQSLAEEAAARALLPALQKLLGSDDAREGFMSFLERRAAKFTGK